MHFQQFYLSCLAHASYFIGSEGEAAVVDPRRDIDIYVDEANTHGFTIKYVIETHLHADFVSGARELAAQYASEACYGPPCLITIARLIRRSARKGHVGIVASPGTHVTFRSPGRRLGFQPQPNR